MLVIGGSIRFDPAHTDTVRAAAVAMMEATLQEEGCEDYVFSISLADDAVIRVFERWDSEASLRAHFATPHMAEFRAAIADIGITERDLFRYEVTSMVAL